MEHDAKQAAYAADITYGTNNEFGFDYLRDNMVYDTARPRAARAEFRHRRRGRLDPDRRGAHAADHFRPGRETTPTCTIKINAVPPLLTLQIGEETPDGKGTDRSAGRLHQGREGAPGAADRSRSRKGRADPDQHGPAAGRRLAVRRRQHHSDPPPVRGAARARAVPQGPALRGAERRSRDRRRIHRPPDDGPPLVGRPAPGGRSQGRRARSRTRTRRWPRSPSRTTSACTASWPA